MAYLTREFLTESKRVRTRKLPKKQSKASAKPARRAGAIYLEGKDARAIRQFRN
jgi:hypothetical protein